MLALQDAGPQRPRRPAPGGGGPIAVVIGHTGVAYYEKDWKVVFEFFPGLRARFEEVYQLDLREEALFASYTIDPATRNDWRDIYTRVMALWNPLKADVERKLVLLGTSRRFNITASGHVNDGDWPDDDDVNDYILPYSSSLRFGEVFIVQDSAVADEMELRYSLELRLAVGPADSIEMEISGKAVLYESGEEKVATQISERVPNGGDSREYRAGEDDDDYGTVRFHFQLAVA